MLRCIIVGAGGMGREVLSWALQIVQTEWQIAGFLDADPRALEGTSFPYGILGDPLTWQPSPEEVFIAGLGQPRTRLGVCTALQERGARFIRMVHPTVVTGIRAEIGAGCVLAPYSVVSACVTLDRFVFLNIAASVGHDSRIGEGSTISSHCDVMGKVVIEPECFLGGHACILPGKKVGRGAMVGAGSAVVRNVPPGSTVMGVPAQILVPGKP